MPDNLKKKGPQDRKRISKQPWEKAYAPKRKTKPATPKRKKKS